MKRELLTAVDESGVRYPFEVKEEGTRLFLTLRKEKIAHVKELRVLGDLSTARSGDEGYYILPRNISMNGDIETFFRPREDVTYYVRRPVMGSYGIKKADLCVLVRPERNYKIAFEVSVRSGEYKVALYYDFTKFDPAYDDIRIEIVELPLTATYADMARAERETRAARGEIVPLTEKCKVPAVEYARQHPLIRIRMGWKPSPTPVPHQTEETEPPMFVACTFARVRELADALRAAGVTGAELQLVGWHIGGHDGRFPQLFPADERLGGDAELKKTIAYVKSLGYTISLHTNLIDAYEIADTFTFDDICVTRENDIYHPKNITYGGGTPYHVCPQCQIANCEQSLPALAALGLNGIHFCDVLSIEEPDVCFAARHPSTTADGIRSKHTIMRRFREKMGAFSSEGCFDFCLKYLDYGLYVSFGDGFGHTEVPICDRVLPWFELTYHGYLLYNPTSPTVNFPIKSPADRLMFLMRGGRPSLYLYSKFRTGGQKNWMGEDDYVIDDEETLARFVRDVREVEKAYVPFADRQLLTMENYEIRDDGIEIATYADGFRVVGNFSEEERTFEGKTLAPYAALLL